MNSPNETANYRQAREQLLAAEIALRDQEEGVAEQRRLLPLGGEVTGEYVFDSTSGAQTFAELFATGKETLYLYNFMFIAAEDGGPLGRACPSCTSIIEAMDGAFRHLLDRMDIAVVAKVPIEQFAAWGSGRGWRFTPLYSSSRSTFNSDYDAESAGGDQRPIAHIFTRSNGRIHHRWSSELLGAPHKQGQEPRHVDYMWPIWKVLDLAPDGRGTDWSPRYSYGG